MDGPTLHGIVGRRVAAEASFEYSPAVRRLANQHPRWTADLLDRLIADPDSLVPGTSMIDHSISDAAERRLIVYLERGGNRTT